MNRMMDLALLSVCGLVFLFGSVHVESVSVLFVGPGGTGRVIYVFPEVSQEEIPDVLK